MTICVGTEGSEDGDRVAETCSLPISEICILIEDWSLEPVILNDNRMIKIQNPELRREGL